jgi:hypothetical protein
MTHSLTPLPFLLLHFLDGDKPKAPAFWCMLGFSAAGQLSHL